MIPWLAGPAKLPCVYPYSLPQDLELGLYYLQSRYYNPAMGRFINADALVSTGQGLLGNNMFAYCRNNPVCRRDISGATDEKCYDGASDPLGDDEDLTGGKMGRNGPDGNGNSAPGGQQNRIGGSGHGGRSLSNASNASSSQAHAPRFTPDQQAVLELAGEYKSGVTMDEARILVDYAYEYGISNHAPMIHPGRSGFWSGILHIKIKNFHIPVIK